MKKIETDVAIVSAGTAALAAAVAAAEKGAQVICFEKSSTTGGTANMGMGPFAVESRIQKAKNVSLTKEEAFKIFMDYTHWRVDARLVSAYINKSADTIDWLEKMGVVFVDAIAYVHGSNFTHHVVKPDVGMPGPRCAGTMMKRLDERARALGVQIMLQTPVKKLIKERNRVVGLIAEDREGDTLQVSAKAVIIATGGFGDSPEWIRKYTGYEWDKEIKSFRIPGLVGEGIKMAWDVGAGTEGMNMELTCGIHMGDTLEETQNMILSGATTAVSPFRHPNLLVNLLGERFMNEESSGNPTVCGNAVSRQPKRTAFMILDEAIVKDYEENGMDWLGPMMPARVSGLTKMVADVVSGSKYLFAADSLDELAQKTGIKAEALKKTVDEYNAACETGRDYVFYKGPRFLRAIKGPRYYAGQFFPGGYGSLGGIKINYKTEVVTKDQEIIPGLYGAGVDANAIYADSYVFVLPGNTMGFALNSGRMAGENAADFAKNAG